MWPDRVSNPGPPTNESGALLTALRGPADDNERLCSMEPKNQRENSPSSYVSTGPAATGRQNNVFLTSIMTSRRRHVTDGGHQTFNLPDKHRLYFSAAVLFFHFRLPTTLPESLLSIFFFFLHFLRW